MSRPPLLAASEALELALAAREPGALAALESASDRLGALVLGARPGASAVDPVALGIALTARVPGLAVVAGNADSFGGSGTDAPYNAARRLLSLDHLSLGRGGALFAGAGEPLARTVERIRVIRELWNSWPRESLVADVARGVFAETDGIRRIEHTGEHFSVLGSLNSPTSLQGEPVSILRVGTAEALAAAEELVDLVVLDDPSLRSERAVELVPVDSAAELASAVAGLAAAANGTLRARLGLPERTLDLSDRPLAFGAARA